MVKEDKKKEESFDEKEAKESEKEEEVCEVFEVEKKDNKEKEVKTCDVVEKKHATVKQIEAEKKTLRNILIGLGLIILIIIGAIYFLESAKHFEYRGISGNVVKEGEIIFYQTTFPVQMEGKLIPYNIYIRNDPRELDKIPFEGEMVDFKRLNTFADRSRRIILNMSDEFDCNEDETIAVGNLINLKALAFKVVRDENATCDPDGRYIYMNVKESDYSGIKQVGEACYDLHVADCEILKVMERFMVETFVKYYEINNIKWISD